MPARALLWIGAATFAMATAAHAAMTISSAKTKNVSCASGVCTPTGGNANLNVSDLVALLASSDITVKSNAAAPDIGILDPHQGAGDPSDDPGITGLTDAQLKSALPAGFDPNVWGQSSSINNGWPYLLANPPQQ